ncbi:MAG: bifunctional (p)ppGpp synthetase/guanosine-3',5'-bis(diphosphate) 3'-pyrophosphohydrolase [Acidobacteria bacterium]|nr:MAG: bifunctional (p)ppGpp synthetase/guanosine-3',5'-bis(diphosphate) 3'-pyrophosphohydrolase [Acidobacteriota bacterium]GIU81205.1 MAG: phosphohydrolase [Pyrinomonadaceae bacterium]
MDYQKTQSENSLEKLISAVAFAARKHKNQKRKDEVEPYINHPLEVAEILVKIGGVKDENILIAAILHDTIEDTDTTEEEIRRLFGQKVCDYVKEVTDDKGLPKELRKKLQIEKASKLSVGAKQIKIADKTSNLCAIIESPPKNWTLETKIEYVNWAKQVVDEMRGVNESLEKYFDEIYEKAKEKLGYGCF